LNFAAKPSLRNVCEVIANDFMVPFSYSRWVSLIGAFALVLGCDANSKLVPPKGNTQVAPFKVDTLKTVVEEEQKASADSQSKSLNRSTTNLAFTEVQQDLGFDHVFKTGAQGQMLAVETLGGGCGWLDYDSDGRIDLICNQGGDPTTTDWTSQPADALFRNLGEYWPRVDTHARMVDPAFSQAIAVGDFDNDGFQDIYISNVTANTLWWNCGDGTFVEVSEYAAVADRRWSSTAAWGDIDKDGDLDLYVCNYLVYDPLHPAPCFDDKGRVTLCNPSKLEPWPDACYVNQGDGTFVEQSQQLGLAGPGNRSLGVAIADFNNDTWPDIYVANDTNDNFLFLNRQDGHFEEQAKLYGCATDHLGMPQGSMGLGVNDFDHNGFLDLYVTNYANESFTLYANFGNNGFQDVTNRMGLRRPTLAYLGFGTAMQDFDHDGQMELFVANGHVVAANHQPNPRMNPQLFSCLDGKSWYEVSRLAGRYFEKLWMARGAATADYDKDGDLDVLVLNLEDHACLLRNDSRRGQWLNMSFIGNKSNRFGIGVRTLLTAGERTYTQEVCGGTSFASSHEPILSFGLGQFTGEVSLRVLWPSGIEQVFNNVPVGQHLIIDERATRL
jgi:enediyne biosynthesis protein E4